MGLFQPMNLWRPQHQVVGVAEDDTGADLLKVLRSQALNSALGADRHEDGRLDRAMGGLQDTTPRDAIGVNESEHAVLGS